MDKWLIEPTIWGACLNMGNTNEMAILVEHMMSMNNQILVLVILIGNTNGEMGQPCLSKVSIYGCI